MILQCANFVLPSQIIPYEKDKQSKIELVQIVLMGLPKPPHKGYILADNWYTCDTLFQTALLEEKALCYLRRYDLTLSAK